MEPHGCLMGGQPFSSSSTPAFFNLRNQYIPAATISLGLDAAQLRMKTRLCFLRSMDESHHSGQSGHTNGTAYAPVPFRLSVRPLAPSREPEFMEIWAKSGGGVCLICKPSLPWRRPSVGSSWNPSPLSDQSADPLTGIRDTSRFLPVIPSALLVRRGLTCFC